MTDRFVLTRKINNPELVFNADPYKDKIPALRYFQQDAGEYWRLSAGGECFMCDGHKYTVIFFKRGEQPNSNSGLFEVRDQSFVARLGREYHATPLNSNAHIPEIRGSVIEGNEVNYPYQRIRYDRRLRMMGAKIYALLCVSESVHFIKTVNQARVIKSSAIKYLDIDAPRVLEEIGIM